MTRFWFSGPGHGQGRKNAPIFFVPYYDNWWYRGNSGLIGKIGVAVCVITIILVALLVVMLILRPWHARMSLLAQGDAEAE